jgi:PPP family 3-phenylpropionic acid transporter
VNKIPPSTILTLTYFTIFGIYGVFIPFLPIILHEQGLSDTQVTLALIANGLAAIFAPLIISHFADRILAIRHLLSVLTGCTTLMTPCWLFVDSLELAVITAFIYFSLIIPALSMLDAYTVQYTKLNNLNSAGKKVGFQSYRVWGSVGFMLPGLALLPLSSFFTINASLLVALSIFFGTIASFCAYYLPENIPIKTNSALPSAEALRAAIQPPLRGIFAATTIAGLALAMFYIAFPRFLQELGNSKTSVGLIINLGVAWEIMLMPWTAKLIERIGARSLVLIGLASIPVRLFVITLWPINAVIIATQFLHAPLVIGLFVSIPIFLGQVAGESYRFSLQSLNTTLVLGVSRSIGPFLGALALQYSGGSALSGLRVVLSFAGILGAVAFLTLLFSACSVKKPLS